MTHSEKNQALLNASSDRIAWNSVLNLLGVGLPLIAGLVVIPQLIKGLGTDRFGILSLIWMVVGYVNLIEFGIGRAMTVKVSSWIASGREDLIGRLIWTGFLVTLTMGAVGSLVFLGVAPFIVESVIHVPDHLITDTTAAVSALAMALPFILPSLALRGALQGLHRFDLVNIVRVLIGLNTFLGPWVVLQFTTSLVPVVWILVAGRLIGFVLYGMFLERRVHFLIWNLPNHKYLGALLTTGGWMMISNIVSPILIHLDRVVIASLLSVAAIAYYYTAFELVTKVLLIPASIIAVVFPVFSALNTVDRQKLSKLYWESSSALFVILFPIVLFMGVFAYEILELWVGADFAAHGYRVMQVLALGVLVNGLAAVPFSYLQGCGYARVAALVHLVELPVSLAVFYFWTRQLGILGAALAWTARVSVDGLAMHWFARRQLVSTTGGRQLGIYSLGTLGALIALLLLDLGLTGRVICTGGLLAAHTYFWRGDVATMLARIRFLKVARDAGKGS